MCDEKVFCLFEMAKDFDLRYLCVMILFLEMNRLARRRERREDVSVGLDFDGVCSFLP